MNLLLRKILLLGVLMLLIAPWFQATLHLFSLAPLSGAIITPEKPVFSVGKWFTAEYQEKTETWLNQTFGFRSLFIRINNQIAFSLFKKARANGVIVGKENYLFEENYIKAYYGTDFIGADSVAHRMQRLRFVHDTLAKLNKNLILVFAAGKGSFYPEFIPDNYHTERKTTNYEAHLQKAKELGIPHIDFLKYFVDHKKTSKYPLYPQYGIHWSYYGMGLAADSLIHRIEQLRHIDMPDLYWDTIEMSQPKKEDYDIADGMNIKFRLKSFEMAYPHYQSEAAEGKTKPSVLVVADSYYWGMYNFGIGNSFSTSHFWFYNKQVYPESFSIPTDASQLNLADVVEQHDLFVIMATEATLPGLGWGFIERLFNHFRPANESSSRSDFKEKVAALREYMRTDTQWMELLRKKATDRKISLDSMMTLDAIYQVEQNEKK